MGTHLTIISYPKVIDTLFEHACFVANPSLDFHTFVRRQKDDDLERIVIKSAPLVDGRPDISVLDLVGHGDSNDFDLGDELVIAEGNPGPALVALNGILPEKTLIRLLGCLTGTDDEGLAMLKSVSNVLGGREVLGTRRLLHGKDFGESGLGPEFDEFTSSKDSASFPLPTRSFPPPERDEAAECVQQLLPDGYEFIGRGQRLAKVDLTVEHQGVQISFAYNLRFAAIKDEPTLMPLLFAWDSEKHGSRPELEGHPVGRLLKGIHMNHAKPGA